MMLPSEANKYSLDAKPSPFRRPQCAPALRVAARRSTRAKSSRRLRRLLPSRVAAPPRVRHDDVPRGVAPDGALAGAFQFASALARAPLARRTRGDVVRTGEPARAGAGIDPRVSARPRRAGRRRRSRRAPRDNGAAARPSASSASRPAPIPTRARRLRLRLRLVAPGSRGRARERGRAGGPPRPPPPPPRSNPARSGRGTGSG